MCQPALDQYIRSSCDTGLLHFPGSVSMYWIPGHLLLSLFSDYSVVQCVGVAETSEVLQPAEPDKFSTFIRVSCKACRHNIRLN